MTKNEGDKGQEKDKTGGNEPQSLKIKIGDDEKTFTSDDVTNLVNQQASATKVSQVASLLNKVSEKYGVDPDTYVTQAEGAFAVMAKLIEDGFIDETGNVVEGKVVKKTADLQVKDVKAIPGSTAGLVGEERIAAIVAKAIGPFQEKIDGLEDDLSRMYRLDLERQMATKHPELDEDDVSRVFGTAMRDKKKNLWQHAEDFVKGKQAKVLALKREHAKEFGIDLDEFEARNKLKELEKEGGSGAVIMKGKKLSFGGRISKDSKDTITPKEATQAFFKRIREQG